MARMNCRQCGDSLAGLVISANRAKGRQFCSNPCRLAWRSGPENFWDKVDKSAGDSGCWIWVAGKDGNGYGKSCRKKAHRRSWEFEHGAIPKGLQVLHKCDNPPCVNPEHLFLGSHQDNHEDKVAKGRQWRPIGARSPSATLNSEKAQRILGEYRKGSGLSEIGRRYGVTPQCVFSIVRGHTWSHATGLPFVKRARA